MSKLALGDRHNRPIAGLGDATRPLTVEIRAGSLGDGVARQHLLVCLINLLARLHGSVEAIHLDVSGDLTIALPNGSPAGEAFQALASLAAWANGGRIRVLEPTGRSNLRIDISADPLAGANFYAWGAGWRSWVGAMPSTFEIDETAPGCLGPYFAAAMVAGEVFKVSKGLLKGRLASDDAYSLWTGELGVWDDVAEGPSMVGMTLPPLYLVGAGAVGQGLMQVLGASGLRDAYVVTIDHDHHDEKGTNLNRCFLAGMADILQPKVDAIKRYRSSTGLDGYEFEGKLNDYLTAAKPGLRSAVAESEARDRYDVVVSAVDLNRSRQDIQGLRPEMVVGGSTDGLRAQAVTYGLVDGAECLGCWNEPEDEKARAMELEAELRSMRPDQLRRHLEGKVEDVDLHVSYLSSPEPRCGQLGEAEVRSFVTAITPEFSVSFVSMAAAVMAAARLLTLRLSAEHAKALPTKGLFHFRSVKADQTTQARRPGCLCCGR